MYSNFQGDIDVAWADGVTLAGSALTGPPAWPADIRPPSPVSLSHCRAVTLQGNVVNRPGVYKPLLVSVGAGVTDVRHNDPSGIRAIQGQAGTVKKRRPSPRGGGAALGGLCQGQA